MFELMDRICFIEAVYYDMEQAPLCKLFEDGTGGMGKFASETGFLDLYDDKGCCAHHLVIERGLVETMLPKLFGGRKKSCNDRRHDLYWQVRNTGFQSNQAADVGQMDLMMLGILAQRHGRSLYRSLGADEDWAVRYRGGGPLLLTDDELMDDMTRYASEGYKTVKLKAGNDCSRDMEKGIRQITKVREAVSSEVGTAVDMSQVFGVEGVVRFAKMAESYDLEWFEEPIHTHDTNGIRALKEMDVNQSLASGESTRISYTYETYLEKGVDHLQPFVDRVIRMDDLLTIEDMCRAQGKTFSSGGRPYLNLLFGCLHNEDERTEYHEPINVLMGAYTLYPPTKKGNRFYQEGGFAGNPLHVNIEKLEEDGLLLNREIYLPD